jgi:hypothetical protein
MDEVQKNGLEWQFYYAINMEKIGLNTYYIALDPGHTLHLQYTLLVCGLKMGMLQLWFFVLQCIFL